jgi:hypothetical protein
MRAWGGNAFATAQDAGDNVALRSRNMLLRGRLLMEVKEASSTLG